MNGTKNTEPPGCMQTFVSFFLLFIMMSASCAIGMFLFRNLSDRTGLTVVDQYEGEQVEFIYWDDGDVTMKNLSNHMLRGCRFSKEDWPKVLEELDSALLKEPIERGKEQ